ncbi:hypothetical protein POVWA2_010830 [Plasmodium ovale wallikeri]|uniref:Uncharacterized protein n=1 Tax=Plasmodium ovale wallikeri TaxID=864142 RepID=A0A1A8YMC5_PLAOA|nr:hypothetical protein POVWA1_010660 [Plasmodium ovale wallikeri]SBT32665.1 hypothetical protein POVWA2_010830 [Plasmodium ovale wallikeri]
MRTTPFRGITLFTSKCKKKKKSPNKITHGHRPAAETEKTLGKAFWLYVWLKKENCSTSQTDPFRVYMPNFLHTHFAINPNCPLPFCAMPSQAKPITK